MGSQLNLECVSCEKLGIISSVNLKKQHDTVFNIDLCIYIYIYFFLHMYSIGVSIAQGTIVIYCWWFTAFIFAFPGD